MSLLLLLLGLSLTEACPECSPVYVSPCNMKFPFGDENDMSTDMSSNDTNMVVCQDFVSIVPEYGRCPFPPEDPEDLGLSDPYVVCPEFVPIPGRPVQIPEGVTPAHVLAQCQDCDVQLTPDGHAVNFKCSNCYDLPDTNRESDLTARDLIYTTYFIEIANYTSVNVSGRENFKP